MFSGVPNWACFTMKSEQELHSKLWLEDHAAVSCAVQNFMTTLADEEVGSKWMTGALGIAAEDVLKAVGAEGEHLVGVVWYGMPSKPLSEVKAPPRKLGLEVVKELP